MAFYSQLFSVQAEHTFFLDGLCPGLDFVPTPGTNEVLAKTGLLIRNSVNGIRVFCDETRSDALHLHLVAPDEPLSLGFRVFAKDPLFRNYTQPPVDKEGSILYFYNRDVDIDTRGRLRLHWEEFVGAADFEELGSAQLEGLYRHQEGLFSPVFLLKIKISEDDFSALQQPAATPKSYYIRFQSGQTFWKYYLLGDLANQEFCVNDRDEEIEFVPGGEVYLADNRGALTFRSKTLLPLRERSNFHFQLRDQHSAAGRLLIRRLPVASAAQISREIIEGAEALVSEIFINR